MGLLEMLFENQNQGPVGRFEINRKKPKPPNLFLLILKLILSIAFTGLIYYAFLEPDFNLTNTLVFIVIFSLYCFTGYYIIPRPDDTNLGWFIFDNPFRFSDDLNRFLVAFLVILYPGRFVGETCFQVYHFFKK